MMEMRTKIGILTIGQSPRTDMTPEMRSLFPSHAEVIEAGALDGLNDRKLKQLAPREGDVTLISRLADGRSVKISKEAILPLLQEKTTQLEKAGARTVILACTGSFPLFESNCPLLYPDRILSHVVSGAFPTGKLGIIVPLPEQVNTVRSKWEKNGLDLAFAVASPYDRDADFEQATAVLREEHVDAIVLDCMGYSGEMKREVGQAVEVPVLLSRSVVARVAAEFV